ncbi:MAG TPA: hypothetical protein VGQ28_10165, partial [Thermoanaerobaculia bacterium]|nr:hypothetical protein [Thermoanaerobaculia bacterium]
LLWILPAAVILVAAANPPGWLWSSSEAAGYDVLEYHLQLPQEWAAGERLWPLKHNVYSFLPSYLEAGYTHIAAILGAGAAGKSPTGSIGLLAHEGAGAVACQFLHAGFGLIASLVVARIVCLLLKQAGLTGRGPAEIGAIAGAILLSLPWMVVVSSMAYNEAAVNAMMAAAILAAIDSATPAARRGLMSGLLVGLACACKPTAAFMVAPVAGILLLGRMPARQWAGACALGACGALATVAPFAIRNWIASGNPVFPAAANWFSSAHWTAEQMARFARAHSEPGSLAQRLGLLLAMSGENPGQEPRGMFHSQWAALWPVGAAALVLAASWSKLRRDIALMTIGSLVALFWWLSFSHCQSRFLLPLAVVLAGGVGLAIGRMLQWHRQGVQPALMRVGCLVLGALPLFLAGASSQLLLTQQQGYPNLFLGEGTSRRSGDFIPADMRLLNDDQRAALMAAIAPESFINNFVRDGKVLMVGGATPLYFRGSLTGLVVYHTTWDTSPLGLAMRAHPAQPPLWTEALRARGIQYVLVDFSEVARLTRDGWSDPDVTLDAVVHWVLECTEPVHEWPADRPDGTLPIQGLYRLKSVGDSPGAGATS